MAYDSINPAVVAAVPKGVRSVLDVGCGGGSLGAALKARDGCSVVGVTFDPAEAAVAAHRLDRVVTADLNDYRIEDLGRFDCVVFSHVLEHLYRPDLVLSRSKGCLGPGGSAVVALPNVAFWKQRLEFLRGRFRYSDGGLMDRTHYRFFDWHTAQELVREAGFVLEEAAADGGFPLSRFLPFARRPLDRLALRVLPNLFGWQVVVRGRVPA
jgi:SAM-dependent methyltransferase